VSPPDFEILHNDCQEVEEMAKIDHKVQNQSAKHLRDEGEINVLAKEQKKVRSAISLACEKQTQDEKEDLKKTSILHYFTLVTPEKALAQQRRTLIEISDNSDVETPSVAKIVKNRAGNRLRQQRYRAKAVAKEILQGERLPNGRKVPIQVSQCLI
jgi:hypothetical protein